jgi:chromosome partitioning protein
MKIWAVITQKGGSGKTTIALHLAVVAKARGLKAVVIDVDPQQSAVKWGNIRGSEPPIVIAAIIPDLARILGRLKADRYDLVIIDTSPRADRDSMDIARLADLIIIPVRPSILDLPAVEDTLRLIGQVGRAERAVIVMNAVTPRTGEAKQAAAILQGMCKLMPQSISERVEFRRALVGGQGATEFAPSSKAAAEIQALYTALEQHQISESR